MASSITLSGSTASPTSLFLDDSEESFVVLSNCPDELQSINVNATPDQLSNLPVSQRSTEFLTMIETPEAKSIPCPSMRQISVVDNVLKIMVTSHESNLSATSELSADEIQQKMGSLLRENSDLKETLKQNNLAIKQQYEALAKWQEDVVKVQQSHQIKFEETKKLVFNLRAENAELKKIANSSNESPKHHVDLKSKISALEFELDTLRQANIKHNQDQTKIIQELELKLSDSEKTKYEESTTLKSQIDSLNSQLKDVELEYNKIRDELAEAKLKIPTDIDKANAENMKTQLKELAQEIVLKNKIIKEKTDLIDTLHEDISKLKIENESIPILKTQVELYQSDFNLEREAREILKTEKDRIAEDLLNLQRRNHKLLEQIELIPKDDRFVHVQRQGSPSSSRNTPVREQTPPPATYTCPVCDSNFRNLGSLEEHVETCLNQNS